ncbi:MAG: DNA polymerase III subunit beta [Oscillatoriaceae cyanobacterium Prado104]|jgi:DNA polymerase-3 subunit beta|nr:DNA polymerase III subunit beta [Oscillatoriaceae cyanobacterium Prado104]
MAKSQLTGTSLKKEVLERTVKKKRSPATAANSAKVVTKSLKKTTEISSACEPPTIPPQEVEELENSNDFAAIPAVDSPTRKTELPNKAILPLSLPSAIEFTCDSRELNDCAQALKGIVPSNSSPPILCNILIEGDAETQQVRLTAYNLEFGMQVSFDANVDRSGKITLPAPILADILGKFPNGRLTLKSSSEIIKDSDIPSIGATLSASRSKHTIRGLAAEEFPVIPSIEQKLVTLPASVLIAALKASLFAVSSEENKRILTGGNFQLSRDEDRGLDRLRVWTTDGHRIARVLGASESSNSHLSSSLEVNFTVPAKVLRLLERFLNLDDKVAIYYEYLPEQPSNFVAFEWKNWRLTAKLLEGQYPVCDQIIAPYRDRFCHQVVVERLSFLKALERLASHSDKSHVTAIIEFDLDAQQVRLSLNNTLSSGTEIVDAKLWGCEFRLKCDIRYLIDTAKAISSSDLRVLMATPTAPLLIAPFGTPALGTEACECEYIVAPQE